MPKVLLLALALEFLIAAKFHHLLQRQLHIVSSLKQHTLLGHIVDLATAERKPRCDIQRIFRAQFRDPGPPDFGRRLRGRIAELDLDEESAIECVVHITGKIGRCDEDTLKDFKFLKNDRLNRIL